MFASVMLGAALLPGSHAEPHSLALSGWMVFWEPRSIERFEAKAHVIQEVMPEWMGMDAQGMPFLRDSITPELKQRMLKAARSHKVKVLAMISNFAVEAGGFEAKRVQAMLKTPATRRAHIEKVVQLLKQDRLDGLDLDIESLEASDRAGFTAYVQEMAAALKKEKMTLSVTVHAKESEPGTWPGPQAQDWAALGKAADRVKIMTYDFSWSGSEPGPIAPTDWTERVMTFATSVIPREKLDLGIAAYGYDWSVKPGLSLKWSDWESRDAQSQPCPVSQERISGQARFSGHQAWLAKAEVARRLKLHGVAVWYFGSEDPAVWPLWKR